ncbi:MAG: PhzF family phenazine biosynthesis protein, partial [Peptoniphilus sp.]
SGVVLTQGNMSEDEMIKAARELNYSETTCIRKLDKDIYDIRYFSPTQEVDLSVHAALSTFWTLAERGYIDNREEKRSVLQYTKAGQLHVDITFHKDEVKFIDIELPSMSILHDVEDRESVAAAFGLDVEEIGIGEAINPVVIDNGIATMLIPIKERKSLLTVVPKRRRMKELSKRYHCLSYHLFYYDSASNTADQRNFSPAIGVWEEAGTGTGSGAMYYYLRSKHVFSADHLVARQGQEIGRPSEIYVSEKAGRIYVGGTARIVMEGIMRI